MKICIESADRVGISQEILATFASHDWNVKSIEVQSQNTFVHIDAIEATLSRVKRLLMPVDGIKQCIEINEMPSEVREKHVQALLAKITDPILDISSTGMILATNQAAKTIAKQSNVDLVHSHIDDVIDASIDALIQPHELSMTVTFFGEPFIADINPVMSANTVTGAVIYLKSVEKVGRQLSLVQSSKDNALQAMIGESEQINLVKSQILRFATLDLPVLIVGKTGTGKELVAQALHQLGPRKDKPFLTINCAAIPEQLLESELFGYTSGAFTGANKGGKPGLFELANGGTLFLDEIAEMSPYLQAKLLRFLQDFRYRKVGGTKEFKADVKIISASHQDFDELFIQGEFREDLFYRLNVLKVELPTLAQRQSDIELLVNYFLSLASQQINQQGVDITAAALELLRGYHWPGNIRQLENTIFRLVALSDGDVIDTEQVQQVLFGQQKNDGQLETLHVQDWASAQAEFEKSLLTQLYPHYPTTRKLAARLNVSHNKIAMKLRAYRIG
ncbi:sigma 54-interacting transcriptional regulator [Thalassotalea sp. PP2-459]|uniref:sigma 54-interacting transcriptional regulator n=1 Tax=Thalassotalea sp. PP2-459 TaxID=1742724 RepID=UPI0009448FCA|nr:sigma 54-interacting transcriptional regulator [Thalassotalea sp. PP2-459]OKY27216.1 Fis family transcriptional regulator [Thalassotalea sp. PP2-459]